MVGPEGVDAMEVIEVVVGVCLRRYTLVRMMMRMSRVQWSQSMYVDGVGTSRCMSDAATGPSHTVGYEDLLPSQCMSRDDREEHTSLTYVGPQSPLPTWLSPPLFSGFAHKGG